MSANKSATGKRSRDCDKSSYTPLKKGKTEVYEPAQSSTFSDLVVGALSFARSLVTSFYPQAQETKTCTCEHGDKCAMCIQKNAEKIEAERVAAEANANADRLATEAERLEAEEHRKIDEEFQLPMSAIPFIKFVSVSTTNGETDNKCDCYGMYVSDKKFIFFVFDEETSTIKKIDFGDSGIEQYNLHPLGIAGALLFNDDGTYNIIEKSIAFFDIDCGKNNTYDDESDEIDDEEY